MTVSNIKAQSCYLHWEAPLDDGGSELTNYIVEKKDVITEEPELEEGEEAPPEPQWVEVTNSIIERKYGVCPDDIIIIIIMWFSQAFKSYLTLLPPSPTGVEPGHQQDIPVPSTG